LWVCAGGRRDPKRPKSAGWCAGAVQRMCGAVLRLYTHTYKRVAATGVDDGARPLGRDATKTPQCAPLDRSGRGVAQGKPAVKRATE
jgi:hypothetical protein